MKIVTYAGEAIMAGSALIGAASAATDTELNVTTGLTAGGSVVSQGIGTLLTPPFNVFIGTLLVGLGLFIVARVIRKFV